MGRVRLRCRLVGHRWEWLGTTEHRCRRCGGHAHGMGLYANGAMSYREPKRPRELFWPAPPSPSGEDG